MIHKHCVLLKTLYFSMYNQWEPHKHNPSVSREHQTVHRRPQLPIRPEAWLATQLCETRPPQSWGCWSSFCSPSALLPQSVLVRSVPQERNAVYWCYKYIQLWLDAVSKTNRRHTDAHGSPHTHTRTESDAHRQKKGTQTKHPLKHETITTTHDSNEI